jgi:hypothetical protein
MWLLPEETHGAPGAIRTHDPCLRRAVLYPAELRARSGLKNSLFAGYRLGKIPGLAVIVTLWQGDLTCGMKCVTRGEGRTGCMKPTSTSWSCASKKPGQTWGCSRNCAPGFVAAHVRVSRMRSTRVVGPFSNMGLEGGSCQRFQRLQLLPVDA